MTCGFQSPQPHQRVSTIICIAVFVESCDIFYLLVHQGVADMVRPTSKRDLLSSPRLVTAQRVILNGQTFSLVPLLVLL